MSSSECASASLEIEACFGFMEPPDVPFSLQRRSVAHHLHLEVDNLEYVWIHETLAETREQDMPWWMRGAYRLMSRRGSSIPELFRIPASQVREVTSAAPNQQP